MLAIKNTQSHHDKKNTEEPEHNTAARKLKKSLSTVAQVCRLIEQMEVCESTVNFCYSYSRIYPLWGKAVNYAQGILEQNALETTLSIQWISSFTRNRFRGKWEVSHCHPVHWAMHRYHFFQSKETSSVQVPFSERYINPWAYFCASDQLFTSQHLPNTSITASWLHVAMQLLRNPEFHWILVLIILFRPGWRAFFHIANLHGLY